MKNIKEIIVIVILMTIMVMINAHHEGCIHDKIINTPQAKAERLQRTTLNYGTRNPFSRDIKEKGKLRIKLIKKYTTLSTEKQNFLNNNVLPKAVERLESKLFVTRVEGNLKLQRPCNKGCAPDAREKCTEYGNPTCGTYGAVETQYLADAKRYTSCSTAATSTTIPGGAGVADTDLIIFVTDDQGDCGTTTLAFAASCFQDQNDRPVAGYINFCKVDTNKEAETVDTAAHEIIHVLGISSGLFGYYRNPQTGEPYTERNIFGQPIVNGQLGVSTNTIKSFTRDSDGETITKIVTPEVVAMAKKYYGCDDANGLELENAGGSGSAGSHIEGRAAYTELMTSTSAEDSAFSDLSLAILESSSWYTINYTAAEAFPFGYKKGCDFLNGKCLKLSGSETTGNFLESWCKEPAKVGCTANHLSKGKCDIFVFDTVPTAYRYFSQSDRGGPQYLDFCPVYRPETSCLDSTKAPSTNSRSEIYGSTSKCLLNTLSTGTFASSEDGGCFQVACPPRTEELPTEATFSFSNGKSVKCLATDVGSKKTVDGLSGQFTCPNLLSVCPPLVTSGCVCINGKCQDGVCICDEGFSGSTCSIKSSAAELTCSVFMIISVILAMML